jgi:CheY-like chemotaxis protein
VHRYKSGRRWSTPTDHSDSGLPGMNDYELAVKMREARPGSQIRLIAVSGYGQETDVARSYAAAFDLHLVKPVDSRRLFETIAALGH